MNSSKQKSNKAKKKYKMVSKDATTSKKATNCLSKKATQAKKQQQRSNASKKAKVSEFSAAHFPLIMSQNEGSVLNRLSSRLKTIFLSINGFREKSKGKR